MNRVNKYKLASETKTFGTHIVHRIVALKTFADVKEGSFGGWVENEKNLSQKDNCWIYDNAIALENAKIEGCARVAEEAIVSGNAAVFGNAIVSQLAKITGNAHVFGAARVWGHSTISEDAKIAGNVYGDAVVQGDACVFANAKIGHNAMLKSNNDLLCIGPIGSRDDLLTMYRTKELKINIVCGCFFGTLDQFQNAIFTGHGSNQYANEYNTAIQLALLQLNNRR